MTVAGLLELNTTYLGWQHYNVIWGLLTATGIAYLPFLVLLLKNVIEPYQSLEPEDASVASVRRMEVDIALALTVVVLAAQPVMTLSTTQLSYESPCTGNVATPGKTGTTFDRFTLVDANVPIWWYAVMAVSAGLSHAAASTLWDCSNNGPTPSGSDLMTKATSVRIDKPDLVQEMAQFSQDCFTPAHADYQEKHPEVSNYPRGETEWPGSRVYLDLPGYYDTRQAQAPVPGWSYDPNRDVMYGNPPDPRYDRNNMGRPYCKEWWTDPQHGLRRKILAALDEQGLLSEVKAFQESQWPDVSLTKLENDLVQNAFLNTAIAMAQQRNPDTAAPADPYGLNLVQDAGVGSTVLTMAGLLREKFQFFAMMNAVKMALPILQALILMSLYALLPMVLVLSLYQPKILMTGTIAIFTVKFWSDLWILASFIENNLVAALYPDGTFWLTPSESNKVSILTMALALLYLVLPLAWSAMMAWAGFYIGGALDSVAARLREPAHRGGQQGADQVLHVVPGLGQAVTTGYRRWKGP
ncbi:MAG: conjugal transfer protein TraG N-terminal domain-containing protein [Candidatus Competibacteraceae bacterium]